MLADAEAREYCEIVEYLRIGILMLQQTLPQAGDISPSRLH